ncbi:MAG: PAS domain S-box protein [Bacteroidales bacterium]|nr:PAS domain S-box protein [Bacteroidales bacterium]
MEFIRQIFDRLNFRSRIALMFTFLSVYIVFFGIYVFFLVGSVKNNIDDFTAYQVDGIYPLYAVSAEINSLVVQNHAIVENETDVVAVQRHHNKFNQFYEVRLKEYENTLKTTEELRMLDKFKSEFMIYQNINKDIIRLMINGDIETARQLLSVKEISAFNQMRKTLDQMYVTHKKNLIVSEQSLRDEISKVLVILCLLFLPLFICEILFATYIIKVLKKSFVDFDDFTQKLSMGIIPEHKLAEDSSDFGQINKNVNDTAELFKKLTEFSNEIAKGVYDAKASVEAPEGSMAKSLIDLCDRLVETEKEQKQRRLEDEQRNWTTQGLAKFGDIMRHSNDNITKLSDDVIKNLVHYINASQGGLFVLDDSDPQHIFLEMASAFAYDRKKFLTRKVPLGDGLIGVCALEKNTIYITDVPEDYMEIESGLGDSKPKCLLIVPLKSEDKIMGVIELASFNILKPYEIQFVEQLGDSIASTLLSQRINIRTAELLSESQKKSDELAVREVELHKTMDEVTVARDEAQRREAEMAGILSAVDETLLKAELDNQGVFESANQKFLSALGYRKDELIGRNIKTILDDKYLDNFDIVWQNICAGQSYQNTYNQKNKYGEVIWLLAQFTPIFDQNGVVIKVLYIANDITEQQVTEERNKRLLAESTERAEMLMATQESMAKNRIEMVSVMTAIDETLMKAEYSVEGNLLAANQKHIETMGYDFETTKGKNILTFIPDEEIVEFKALWQNVCEGNLHQMTVKRKSKLTGHDIWLINQYTPVRDTQGKVFKVLYTAFDITSHKEIEEQAMKQVETLRKQNEELSSQLSMTKANESSLKTKLGEIEKVNSLADNYQQTSVEVKYHKWLDSFES